MHHLAVDLHLDGRFADQGPALAAKINIENPLKGTKDQICSMQFTVYGIWNFSKNIDAARQFLIDYSDDWPAQMTASKASGITTMDGFAGRGNRSLSPACWGASHCGKWSRS